MAGVKVSGREICTAYQQSKNKSMQIQILAELNNISRIEIIKILLQNGEKLPSQDIRRLYRRLDILDAQISEKEKEYREIVQALYSNKG